MTRVNCIDPSLLLDEHLQAHLREGLRPINEIRSGRVDIRKSPKDWKLNTGHVLFCRKHARWTHKQWYLAKQEQMRRGLKGFDWNPTLSGIPLKFHNDYEPSEKAIRDNIARICNRWRNRKKVYHFKGEPIDSVREFRQYISYVKTNCNL